MNYQPLFDYMSKEHGLTLLEGEMIEIIKIVNSMQAAALLRAVALPLTVQMYR